MVKEKYHFSITITSEMMEDLKKLEGRQSFKPSRSEMVRQLLAIGIREMLKEEE